MSLKSTWPQMSGQLELPFGNRGESSRTVRSEEARLATDGNERSGTSCLMIEMVSRRNLQAALKRVRRNKGSPGIDGMTVDELPSYLRTNWRQLREDLLAGRYQPSPVLEKLIPKSGGGKRKLGIPTVLSSKRFWAFCSHDSTRVFPNTATVFGLDEALTKLQKQRGVLFKKVGESWSMLTCRSSSIESTTTC